MRVTRRGFLGMGAAGLIGGCGQAGLWGGGGSWRSWGERGVRNGQFQRPRAVGVREGGAGDPVEVYVIDTTGRIPGFHAGREFLRVWSTPEQDNGTPTAVAFGLGGRVLVPDTHYSRILEYSPEGELLVSWGAYGTGDDEFIYPTDIAQTADGAYFVCEYGGGAERVHVFDAERRYVRQWGGHGAGAGEFDRAMGIEVDGRGVVHVADMANHRIQRFSRDGKPLGAIGRGGTAPGELKYPYDLSLASDGAIFVCEYGTHRVSRFTQAGDFVACYGRRPGTMALNGPRGLAVCASGRVFVADTDNYRVQCFEPGDLS